MWEFNYRGIFRVLCGCLNVHRFASKSLSLYAFRLSITAESPSEPTLLRQHQQVFQNFISWSFKSRTIKPPCESNLILILYLTTVHSATSPVSLCRSMYNSRLSSCNNRSFSVATKYRIWRNVGNTHKIIVIQSDNFMGWLDQRKRVSPSQK